MINIESLRSDLEKRNITLNPPADPFQIHQLQKILGRTISSSILNVYLSFNGFDDDFDQETFISVWPISEILRHVNGDRLPYIPFADRSFNAEIFEVCAIDANQPITEGSEIIFASYDEFWRFLLSDRRFQDKNI